MSSTCKCTYGTEHKFYHKWTAIKPRKIKKMRQSRIRNIQIFHPVNPIVRSACVPKENKGTKKFTARDIQQWIEFSVWAQHDADTLKNVCTGWGTFMSGWSSEQMHCALLGKSDCVHWECSLLSRDYNVGFRIKPRVGLLTKLWTLSSVWAWYLTVLCLNWFTHKHTTAYAAWDHTQHHEY